MNFRFKILIIWTCLFANCQKEMDVDQIKFTNMLVIDAILNPDSLIKIKALYNAPIGKNEFINPSNLKIKVFENNVFVGQCAYMSGYYKLNIKPKPNYNYSLIIENGTEIIETQTKLIYPISIISKDTLSIIPFNQFNINYQIRDSLKYNDYYYFKVNQNVIYINDNANQYTLFFNNSYLVNHPQQKLNNQLLNSNIKVYNDAFIDGHSKNWLLNISKASINIENDKIVKNYLVVEVAKISYELYNFYNNIGNNLPIYGSPFFNPDNNFSNIKNGIGLMASQHLKRDTIYFKR